MVWQTDQKVSILTLAGLGWPLLHILGVAQLNSSDAQSGNSRFLRFTE